ncbi:MAG: Cytochrome c oxidase subunit 6A, mitochondrial [Aureobasidium pullulans]|nr:MAG: Cytochrome c oxidase subunit 6A, mitochondrial [Aureobasidium pullulans]
MHDKNGVANNLEFGEIAAEVSIMMNAGSTTTAIAMTNVMYWLLKHPACLQKLTEEIDDVLDEEEVIAPYEKVKYLPYLRACLDESLRIFPPTSHGLTRSTPPEGSVICGEFVPGNTTVSVSAFVAHRDPAIFPEPEKYLPERWLATQEKNSVLIS